MTGIIPSVRLFDLIVLTAAVEHRIHQDLRLDPEPPTLLLSYARSSEAMLQAGVRALAGAVRAARSERA